MDPQSLSACICSLLAHVSFCIRNATDAKLPLHPVASTSYLDENATTKAVTHDDNVASIAILSAIGVMSMLFLGFRAFVSRNRGTANELECSVGKHVSLYGLLLQTRGTSISNVIVVFVT